METDNTLSVAGAEFIVESFAALGIALVWVLGRDGRVIAGHPARPFGHDGAPGRAGETEGFLHVALPGGQVVVLQPPAGTLAQPMAEALVHLLADQAGLERTIRNSQEARNRYLSDLLRGPLRDEARLRRAGQLLGMHFVYPRAVLVLDAGEYITGPINEPWTEAAEARIARRSQLVLAAIARFFHQGLDVGYLGDGEVVILKTIMPVAGARSGDPRWDNLHDIRINAEILLTQLRSELNANLVLGIGRPWPGLAGLARSYTEARETAGLLRRYVGFNRAATFDSLGLAALVGSTNAALRGEYAAHLLAPLAGDPDLELSLRTYFAHDGTPGPAAQELHIHRNTLTYRLDKIATMTGLDPRRFDQAVLLRVALMLQGVGATEPVIEPVV
jgi:carbohydrate diacid regulator